MGQTLTNGIYLPAEGEVRCYNGLASNWTTLDAVVGGYNAHVANENIHITSAERNKWDNGVTQAYVLRYASVSLTALGTVAFSALDNTDNIKIGDKVLDSEGKLFALTAVDTANSTATLSALLIDLSKDSDLSNYYTKPETDTLLNDKADASALTAHTGNATIHVTAEDKNKWDAVTGKANDTDVIHISGNESSTGKKVFGDMATFKGSYLGNEATTHSRTNLLLESIRDTSGESGLYFAKYRANKAQGALVSSDIVSLGFDVLENSSRYNSVFSFQITGWTDGSPTQAKILSTLSSSSFGSSTRKSLINDINPGALSLPNLSAGVDISAYITDITGASNINKFTPTADGWISIGISNAEFIELYIPSALMGGTFTKTSTNNYAQAFMPVIANKEVRIALKGATIGWAKFYPCQGNV